MSILKANWWGGAPPSPPDLCSTQKKSLEERKTILLAEDDNDLRYVMECTFTAMGYNVVACADAQLASWTFRSRTPIDILLTDFQMPGRSGIDLARELTGLCPALPVMIITGSALSAAIFEEIRERGWIYVSKPCRLPSLEASLEQALKAGHSGLTQGERKAG